MPRLSESTVELIRQSYQRNHVSTVAEGMLANTRREPGNHFDILRATKGACVEIS